MDYQRHQDLEKYMNEIVLPSFENLMKSDISLTDRIAIQSTLHQLQTCGHYHYWIDCQKCKTSEFVGFSSCKNRYCLPCARKKSLIWLSKLAPAIIDQQKNGKSVSHMVLTIRNTNDLKDGLLKINSSYRNISHSNYYRNEWKRRFPGGVRTIEVKRGKNSGKWHPHLHLLVIKDKPEKDYDYIKTAWKSITKNDGSVFIRAVKKEQVIKSVLETTKYVLKPDKHIYNNKDDLLEVYKSMKGLRQINSWGQLRGLSVKDDELETYEEKKLATFICKQCGCTEGQLIKLLNQSLLTSIA